MEHSGEREKIPRNPGCTKEGRKVIVSDETFFLLGVFTVNIRIMFTKRRDFL